MKSAGILPQVVGEEHPPNSPPAMKSAARLAEVSSLSKFSTENLVDFEGFLTSWGNYSIIFCANSSSWNSAVDP